MGKTYLFLLININNLRPTLLFFKVIGSGYDPSLSPDAKTLDPRLKVN